MNEIASNPEISELIILLRRIAEALENVTSDKGSSSLLVKVLRDDEEF